MSWVEVAGGSEKVVTHGLVQVGHSHTNIHLKKYYMQLRLGLVQTGLDDIHSNIGFWHGRFMAADHISIGYVVQFSIVVS